MIEGYAVHKNVLPPDVLAQVFDFLKELPFTRIERPAMRLSRSLQDDNTNNEAAHFLIRLLKRAGLDALIEFDDVSVVRYDAASDYVDWHSDGGPLLEPNTQMGVLSFGASRVMEFRRKAAANQALELENLKKALPSDIAFLNGKVGAAEDQVLLEENDLIVSRAGFQELYQHRIPPSKTDELRISIVLFTHSRKKRK
jgi:hypothetical protein